MRAMGLNRVSSDACDVYQVGKLKTDGELRRANIKRHKILKINVKAANSVVEEIDAYNAQTRSVPKPVDA